MSALQVAGTLLAIPVGLASAYSVYRTSFSPEAACRTLRANIVVMLDKNVDLTTRRMLVRRDIEAFDQSCADVDPDAKAAFSVLLSADKAAAPVATAPAAEAQPKPAIRKVEPRPAVAAKQPTESTASVNAADTERGERDAAASDAAWLAAVRHALVTGAGGRKSPATAAKSAAVPLAPTGIKPISPETRAVSGAPPQVLMPPAPASAQSVIPASPAPAQIVMPSAPTLPPPIAVTSAAAPKSDPDHPVPPAPIPEMTSPSNDAEAPLVEEPPRSRLRQWVARRLRFWDDH